MDAPIIVGKDVQAPLLYEGSSLLVDPENPLVLEVLVASSTAYSYDPTKSITEVYNFNSFDSISYIRIIFII